MVSSFLLAIGFSWCFLLVLLPTSTTGLTQAPACIQSDKYSANFADWDGVSHITIAKNGSIIVWGANTHGQLGLPTYLGGYEDDPVVLDLGEDNGSPAVSVHALSQGPVDDECGYMIALLANGNVHTWGCNIGGILGSGDEVRRYTPTKISFGNDQLAQRVQTFWDDSRMRSFAVVTTTSGDLYSWGYAAGNMFNTPDLFQWLSPRKLEVYVTSPGTSLRSASLDAIYFQHTPTAPFLHYVLLGDGTLAFINGTSFATDEAVAVHVTQVAGNVTNIAAMPNGSGSTFCTFGADVVCSSNGFGEASADIFAGQNAVAAIPQNYQSSYICVTGEGSDNSVYCLGSVDGDVYVEPTKVDIGGRTALKFAQSLLNGPDIPAIISADRSLVLLGDSFGGEVVDFGDGSAVLEAVTVQVYLDPKYSKYFIVGMIERLSGTIELVAGIIPGERAPWYDYYADGVFFSGVYACVTSANVGSIADLRNAFASGLYNGATLAGGEYVVDEVLEIVGPITAFTLSSAAGEEVTLMCATIPCIAIASVYEVTISGISIVGTSWSGGRHLQASPSSSALDFSDVSLLQVDGVVFEGLETAGSGGAISVIATAGSSFACYMNRATFNANHALQSGGAVYLDVSGALDAVISIAATTFRDNVAGVSGGALHWKREARTATGCQNDVAVSIDSDVVFADNAADLWGDNLASDTCMVAFANSPAAAQTAGRDFVGDITGQTLELHALDYYGNLVGTEADLVASIAEPTSSPPTSSYWWTSAPSYNFVSGKSVLNGLAMAAQPSSSFTYTITADSQLRSFTVTFAMSLLPCGAGTFRELASSGDNLYTCRDCLSGTFSDTNEALSCTMCSAGYYCMPGAQEEIPCPQFYTSTSGSGGCVCNQNYIGIDTVAGCIGSGSRTSDCPTAGEIELEVTGWNFGTGNLAVQVGGAECEVVNFYIDLSILDVNITSGDECIVPRGNVTCILPPGVGVNEFVSVFDITGSASGQMLSYASPTVQTISGCTDAGDGSTFDCPRNATSSRTLLTVTGTNFGPDLVTVMVGGVTAEPSSLDDNNLAGMEQTTATAWLPSGSGSSLAISVIQRGGEVSNGRKLLSYVSCGAGHYNIMTDLGYFDCAACGDGEFNYQEEAFVCEECSGGEMLTDAGCIVCPKGFVCTGESTGISMGNVALEMGWWRTSAFSLDARECPVSGACVGGIGAGNDLCEAAHIGPYCSVCMDGYTKSFGSQACTSCGNSSAWSGAIILAVVVVLAVFATYFIYRLRTKARIMSSFIHEDHEQAELQPGANSPNISLRINCPSIPHFAPWRIIILGDISTLLFDLQAKLKGLDIPGYAGMLNLRILLKTVQLLLPRVDMMMCSISGVGLPQEWLEKLHKHLAQLLSLCRDLLDAVDLRVESLNWDVQFNYPARFCSLYLDLKGCLPRLSVTGLQSVFKILVTFCQILASMPSVFLVQFPPIFANFLSFLSVLNLSFLEAFSLGCITSMNYYAELFLKTVMPLLISVIIWLASLRMAPATKVRAKEAFLVLTYLVLPGTTMAIFRTFPCESFDDGTRWLRADYSIDCTSSQHKIAVAYASVMVLVYPVGVPAGYFYILWRNRGFLNPVVARDGMLLDAALVARDQNKDKISSFSFLWKSYEPRTWWFEIFETARRLTLTGFIIFFMEGTATQISLAMLVTLLSMVVYLHYAPFVDNIDDRLAFTSMTLTFLTLFGALLIRVGVAEDEGYNPTALGGVLLVLNVSMIFLCAWAFYMKASHNIQRAGSSARGVLLKVGKLLMSPLSSPRQAKTKKMACTGGKQSEEQEPNYEAASGGELSCTPTAAGG